MADLESRKESRKYDELDRVLAAQPLLKAPTNTRANVMARLATLPQTQLSTVMAVSAARYAAPVLLPDPIILESDEREERRLLAGLIFAGAWLGLTMLVGWAVWLAFSNLSPDPVTALINLWNNVATAVVGFFSNYQNQLPTMVSLGVGLSVLVFYIFGPNLRRSNRLSLR